MPHLHPIERLAAALVVVAAGLSLAFASTRFALGVAVGGVLSVLNFYVLRTLMRGLTQSKHPPKQAMLALLLMLKFAIMGAAIFILINYAPLAPGGMLLGVSVVVLSILIEGFRIAMRGAGADDENGDMGTHEQDVDHG